MQYCEDWRCGGSATVYCKQIYTPSSTYRPFQLVAGFVLAQLYCTVPIVSKEFGTSGHVRDGRTAETSPALHKFRKQDVLKLIDL